MKLWSDLVATALVGTARASMPPLPAPDTALGRLLEQLRSPTGEHQLLVAAAIVDAWQRSGTCPLVLYGTSLSPAPGDGRPSCSLQAAQYLAEILLGDMGAMLGEWLDALATSGRTLPYRWLPELLDMAYSQPALRPRILPLLRERGRWLAAQHPRWGQLVALPDDETLAARWETGTLESRLELLRHLRTADADRGRELLLTAFSKERAPERVKFLDAMRTGLTPTDELFLEATLGDRSKRVRPIAADLLACLPGSALVQRVRERLLALIRLESGVLRSAKLEVSLPRQCSEAMAHDGVLEAPPSGLGKRVWWMLQMLTVVPPSVWSQQWAKSPKMLVGLAGKTEHTAILLEGWGKAAARHHDGDWAEALLQRWVDEPWSVFRHKRPLYFLENLDDLVTSVPQERLEAWLVKALRARVNSLGQHDSLRHVLLHHRRSWGEALTRAVLDGLRALTQRDSRAWLWRDSIVDLARYASPRLADEAERGWPESGYWARNADRFLTVLRFRRGMLASLR